MTITTTVKEKARGEGSAFLGENGEIYLNLDHISGPRIVAFYSEGVTGPNSPLIGSIKLLTGKFGSAPIKIKNINIEYEIL